MKKLWFAGSIARLDSCISSSSTEQVHLAREPMTPNKQLNGAYQNLRFWMARPEKGSYRSGKSEVHQYFQCGLSFRIRIGNRWKEWVRC